MSGEFFPGTAVVAKVQGVNLEALGLAGQQMRTAVLAAVEPLTKLVRELPPVKASRLSLTVTISPLRLVSEANAGGRLPARIARKSAVKEAVRAALPAMAFPLPCTVCLTRLSSRQLDSEDNLPMCFKAVKDVIADWLGVDDADPRVRWRYDQRPGWVAGCRIRVRERL